MKYFELFPLIAFVINVFLFAYVYVMDKKSTVNRSFLLTMALLSGWQFSDYFGWHFMSDSIKHGVSHIAVIFWIPATVALLNFIYEYLEKPRDLIWRVMVVLTLICTILGVFTNTIVDSIIIEYWGYRPTLGVLYFPSVIVCSVIPGGYLLFLLLMSFLKDTDENRRKLSLLLFSLISLGLAAILVFNVVLSNLLNMGSVPQLGSTLSIFLSIAIFIAIDQFNFLSVDIKNSARAIFSQLDEGVVLVDTKGVVVEMNNYLLKIFKLERSQVIGNSIDRLPISKYSFKTNFSGEEMMFDVDGESKVFLVSQKNMYQGKIYTGKIILYSDITRLKNNEKEIAALNVKLKDRVTKKTELLNNAERKIIENQYKDELASITTSTLHNVKNLLNSLKISVERSADVYSGTGVEGLKLANGLLRDNLDQIETFIAEDEKGKKLMQYYLVTEENLDAEIKQSKAEVERAINKIQAIENIIYAQQGYSGANQHENIYLEDIIEDVLIMEENMILQNKMSIVKDFRNSEMIKGDKVKLIHVVINVLKNAKDAMVNIPYDEKRVTIKTSNDEGNVILIISDVGKGIALEHLPDIFTRGFTTKQDGHGYGLHASKKYIEEMGGTMSVTSEGSNLGASFTVKLPC